MIVTREMVADRLKGYLLGHWSLEDTVSWAEDVMVEGEIGDKDLEVVRDITARLGLSDVVAFGLTWEDIKEFLERLGQGQGARAGAMVHKRRKRRKVRRTEREDRPIRVAGRDGYMARRFYLYLQIAYSSQLRRAVELFSKAHRVGQGIHRYCP